MACGFEHSVANMYFIPTGLFIKGLAPAPFWATAHQTAGTFSHLSWWHFLQSLVPVTLGNIIGGTVFVGIVYWVIHLRKERGTSRRDTPDSTLIGQACPDFPAALFVPQQGNSPSHPGLCGAAPQSNN